MKSFDDFYNKAEHTFKRAKQEFAHKLPHHVRNVLAAAYATGRIHDPDRPPEEHERLKKFRRQLLTHKVPKIKTVK
jgi:hypothetical protein